MNTPAPIHELPELHNRLRVFRDRREAGAILSRMLANYRGSTAVVLAIPAGGVPVATEIAEQLHLPLDVIVVSKFTLPWNTEAGYGALAFDGTERLNQELVARAGLSARQIAEGREQTRNKVAQRLERWRGTRPFPDLSSRTAILVDDGLASGYTVQVAIAALRHQGALQIVVAIPTAHTESLLRVASDVEAIYCANIREGLRFAVADAYEFWTDVSDEAVTTCLSRFNQANAN